MPLPATWLALPHVGTAGNQRSHPAACADSQVRGLLRRRQPEHRSVCTHDVPDLQRRNVSELPQATAAPTNAWAPNDRRTRQCPLSSRETLGPVPASPCSTTASAIPTALQPATRPDRASLETDPAPGNAQPLLCNASRRTERRQRLLQSLAPTKQRVASPMLHYLRRCV